MNEQESQLIETGLALIDLLEHHELSLAALLDRIEILTADPALQRTIIEQACEEGLIERDGTTIRPTSPNYLRFGADVRSKDGDFSCRRCGASLTRGYFIQLETDELGAFGSTCVRKIMGRD